MVSSTTSIPPGRFSVDTLLLGHAGGHVLVCDYAVPSRWQSVVGTPDAGDGPHTELVSGLQTPTLDTPALGLSSPEHGVMAGAQAGMYHLIRATGHAEGWSVAYYFFTFIRGILFFTVVVLIGTGWSYLKVRQPACPFLSRNSMC